MIADGQRSSVRGSVFLSTTTKSQGRRLRIVRRTHLNDQLDDQLLVLALILAEVLDPLACRLKQVGQQLLPCAQNLEPRRVERCRLSAARGRADKGVSFVVWIFCPTVGQRSSRKRTSSGPSRPACASSHRGRRCSDSPAGRSLPAAHQRARLLVSAGTLETNQALGGHGDHKRAACELQRSRSDTERHKKSRALNPQRSQMAISSSGQPRATKGRTFSIANSSSALTCISRAFSRASWLMKAT